MNGCTTCGGFGDRHDSVAHADEVSWTSDWIICRTCRGNGTVRDSLNLDVPCPECGGDGGWER